MLLGLRFGDVREFDSCRDFLDGMGAPTIGCLVLDIHMPDMSGFDLMQQLREDGAPIPTILVTGRTDASIRARATELGAVALLEKPVEYSDLLVAIERALDPGR